MPGVPPLGLNIDRCITREEKQSLLNKLTCRVKKYDNDGNNNDNNNNNNNNNNCGNYNDDDKNNHNDKNNNK